MIDKPIWWDEWVYTDDTGAHLKDLAPEYVKKEFEFIMNTPGGIIL
jgi:hypothetical protein